MTEHDDDELLDAIAALDPVDEGSLPDGSSPTARRLLEEIMSDTATTAPPIPPATLPPARDRRPRRLGAAAAAVAVAVAAGATLWPSATPSASATVAEAIGATLDAADGSARYTLVAEVDSSLDGPAELRAEGVIADGDLAATSVFTDLTGGTRRTEEVRLVDGDVFLRSDDGAWEVVPDGASEADPFELFDELQEVAEFEEVGSDVVGADPVTVYRADGATLPDPAGELSAAFVAFGLFVFAGDTAPGADPPEIELAVDDDGLVRRLDVSGEQGAEQLRLTVDVFDLGADVDVEAPADVDVSPSPSADLDAAAAVLDELEQRRPDLCGEAIAQGSAAWASCLDAEGEPDAADAVRTLLGSG